jgi:hypothetical protein
LLVAVQFLTGPTDFPIQIGPARPKSGPHGKTANIKFSIPLKLLW